MYDHEGAGRRYRASSGSMLGFAAKLFVSRDVDAAVFLGM
jgi:hypothetical protein